MRTTIIVGAEGQDGRILFDILKEKGHRLVGIDKSTVRCSGFDYPTAPDIASPEDVFALVSAVSPDEVYYFAAFHGSSEEDRDGSVRAIRQAYHTNVLGLIYFLEAMRRAAPNCRLFYAASCLVFEATETKKQDEKTPYAPSSIYGITKRDGLDICRLYRTKYRLFAAAGIFYNHESKFRPPTFISQKIISGALAAQADGRHTVTVGDLDAAVDWGYAPDYLDACRRIMALDAPDDFIIATGEKHTVREFVQTAFSSLRLDWRKHVTLDPALVVNKRRALVGDARKLFRRTGWRPSRSFSQMVWQLLHDSSPTALSPRS